MRKFWALLFIAAVAIALTNFNSSGLSFRAVAQQPPAEFSLEPMNVDRLDAILQEQVGNVSAQPGQWQFSLDDTSIVILADANADRMRIFTPIINAAELSDEQVQKMMLANFHTALDARYAISNRFVVSTFIHPLARIRRSQNQAHSCIS